MTSSAAVRRTVPTPVLYHVLVPRFVYLVVRTFREDSLKRLSSSTGTFPVLLDLFPIYHPSWFACCAGHASRTRWVPLLIIMYVAN